MRSVISRRFQIWVISALLFLNQPPQHVLKTVAGFLSCIQFFPRLFGNADVFVSISAHICHHAAQRYKELFKLAVFTKFTKVTSLTFFTVGSERVDE